MEGPKRRVRRKHAEEHGGSHGAWKVAYADFVTAMMAFFLLLWLLTMTSNEQRARVSAYFKYFSIFEKSGSSSLIDLSKSVMTPMTISEQGREAQSKKDKKSKTNKLNNKNIEQDTNNIIKKDTFPEKHNKTDAPPEQQKKEELQSRLKKIIEKELADVKSQVMVDGFKNCVRVQLIDEDGSMMFPTGSNTLTARAKEVLRVITNSIKDFSGPIAIEGHTDSRPYPSQVYTNWELSVDRASEARREMVACGLNVNQLVRVTGFADKKLINKEDPFDPRNRRISILLYKPKEKAAPVISPPPINIQIQPNSPSEVAPKPAKVSQ